MRSILILVTLLAVPAAAQAQSQAQSQTSPPSTMGPATAPAQSGVGTAGSLDHNAGTASSRTGANTPMGGTPANKGADQPKESDPTLGAGSQK